MSQKFILTLRKRQAEVRMEYVEAAKQYNELSKFPLNETVALQNVMSRLGGYMAALEFALEVGAK